MSYWINDFEKFGNDKSVQPHTSRETRRRMPLPNNDYRYYKKLARFQKDLVPKKPTEIIDSQKPTKVTPNQPSTSTEEPKTDSNPTQKPSKRKASPEPSTSTFNPQPGTTEKSEGITGSRYKKPPKQPRTIPPPNTVLLGQRPANQSNNFRRPSNLMLDEAAYNQICERRATRPTIMVPPRTIRLPPPQDGKWSYTTDNV